MRKWWAIAVPALLSLSACAPTIEAGPGIVSTSLCGDSYVLAAEHEIAALSWQSDGPLSRATQQYRKASADPELLVALQPDTLLLGHGEVLREDLLPKTDVIRLDWAEDWAGVQLNMAKLDNSRHSRESGNPQPISLQLNKTSASATMKEIKTVLYLSRAGGTAGPGTYVHEAIQMAGGRNLVTQSGWFTPDPEWIVAQNPDLIITSFFGGYESVNATGQRNRAVSTFLDAHRRVYIPGSLWPCAGPGLVEAVDLIATGLQ